MRKIVCLMLVFVLALHSGAFAIEEAQHEEFEKLVIIAKNAIDVNEDEYIFDTYSKSNNKLNLSWKSKDESKNGYISVVIDEEGDILNYSKDYKYDDKYKLLSLPDDDKIKYEAESFLKKIAYI